MYRIQTEPPFGADGLLGDATSILLPTPAPAFLAIDTLDFDQAERARWNNSLENREFVDADGSTVQYFRQRAGSVDLYVLVSGEDAEVVDS